jgi:ABC-type amino acid transport substrate-binding protein
MLLEFMKKILTLIAFCLCFSVFAAQKQNDISLVFPLVDGWAHKTEPAYAPTALRRISKNGLIKKMSMGYRPFKRALMEFGQAKFDCFVGGDEKTMKDFAKVETISSKMIRNTTLRAYSLKDNKKITSLDQLKGKKIVYVRGVDFNSLNFKFNMENTKSVSRVQQAVEMMKSKRVDLFLHWFPSTPEIMNDFHNHGSITFYHIKERVNCHINPRTTAFIKKLNKDIISFKGRGDLKKLYKEFYGTLPFGPTR